MSETLKRLTPLHIYLLSATVYGAILSVCSLSFVNQSTQAEILFFFSTSFFTAFLLSYDGKAVKRLFLISLMISLFSTFSFVWPIGVNGYSFSSHFLSLIALITAINLLTVYHKERSLIPSYQIFFNQVWEKISLFLLVLLFSLGIVIIIALFVSIFSLLGVRFIEIFFENKIVISFLISFSIIMGLYTCQQFERFLFQLKDILVRFTVIFFVLLSLISWLFILTWIVKSLSNGELVVSKGTYIYTLFWFAFFNLIFYNGTFPFYQQNPNKHTAFMKLIYFFLVSYPFIGLIITSLMYGAFYDYTYDLVTSAHGVEYYWVSQNNFIEYIAFTLLWAYYALYCLGKLISKDDYLSNWLPKVNLILACILTLSTWGFINPLTSSILKLQIVEGAPSLSNAGAYLRPETALFGTGLSWQDSKLSENPLTLGRRDGQNLYACQVSFKKNLISGEATNDGVCLINFEDKVHRFKKYKVLSGEAELNWSVNDYQNMLIKTTFLEHYTVSYSLCRTIYNDHIYIGYTARRFMSCNIVVNHKALDVPGLQLLYVKK